MRRSNMNKHKALIFTCLATFVFAVALFLGTATAQDTDKKDVNVTTLDKVLKSFGKVTPSERKAAAKNAAALGLKIAKPPTSAPVSTTPSTPEPGADQDSAQTN
jgi:hypothetical protein